MNLAPSPAIVLTVLLSSVPAAQAVEVLPPEDLTRIVRSLEQQVGQLQEALKNQNEVIARLSTAQISPPASEMPVSMETHRAAAPSWRAGGDFRLRSEAFQFTSGSPAEDDDRTRFRLRMRYGFEKDLGEDVTFGARLVTGSSTDPTSALQTLDSNFTFKDVFLDKAFVRYAPAFLKDRGALQAADLTVGKMDNPFETPVSQMIWDLDVKPEGVAETAVWQLFDEQAVSGTLFTKAGQFILDEDAAGGGDADAELFAVQGGVTLDMKTPGREKPVSLTSAVSYYDFSNYGTASNFAAGAAAGATFARGNDNGDGDATELDAGDFNILHLYNEIGLYPFDVPLSLFSDYAVNLADRDPDPLGEDNAWGLGAKIKTKRWEAGYSYYMIEPNAIVGAFSDSDFGGPGYVGHADRRGSVVQLGYKLADNLWLRGSVKLVGPVSGSLDEESRRFQVDLDWKL